MTLATCSDFQFASNKWKTNEEFYHMDSAFTVETKFGLHSFRPLESDKTLCSIVVKTYKSVYL